MYYVRGIYYKHLKHIQLYNLTFVLISKTIKGFPVSFMKNIPKWHYRSPNKNEYLIALKEIENYEKSIS